MQEPFVIDQYNATSKRRAIFAEETTSAWLYLTRPDDVEVDGTAIAGDAFVHNRVQAPMAGEDLRQYAPDPPPATEDHIAASDRALCENAHQHNWDFLWSDDGQSVTILRDELPMAMIISGCERGYSRNLQKHGPWGSPWCDEVFERAFGIR